MKAWHFIKNDKTMNYGKGETIVVGKKYSVEGEIKLCEFGLHGSINPNNALIYAPGSIICWCEFGGEIILGHDKLVAQERTVLWMSNAKKALGEYSRWCALEVIENWNAPKIVIEYLNTGNNKKLSEAKLAIKLFIGTSLEHSNSMAARASMWACLDDLITRSASWSAKDAIRSMVAKTHSNRQDIVIENENKQNKKLTEMLNSLQGEITC